MNDEAVTAVIVWWLSSLKDTRTVQISPFLIINKIRNLKFALHLSLALLTTFSIYALSYWFRGIAPSPIAECMYEMEIRGGTQK